LVADSDVIWLGENAATLQNFEKKKQNLTRLCMDRQAFCVHLAIKMSREMAAMDVLLVDSPISPSGYSTAVSRFSW
jgi:hypothetical protein